MSDLKHIKNVTVYRDEKYYCGPGPTAVVLDHSEILVAFRRCLSWTEYGYWDHYHPNTEACIVRTADEGDHWSSPEVFWKGGITNQNFRVISDGAIVATMFDNVWVPNVVYDTVAGKRGVYKREMCNVNAGAFTTRSEDGGRTWTKPFWVERVPGVEPVFDGWNSPLAIRGPVEQLADGDLLYPVYVGVSGDGGRERAFAVASSDGGRTWSFRGLVAEDPTNEVGFNELTFHQCPSGKVVAFIRSAGADGWLFTATSKDNGRTWTDPVKEDCWGHPFVAASMPSGNVLLCYGYRREPCGIRARLLGPECDNIADSPELVLRDDGVTFDLGYPDLTILPDGRAFIVYYMNSKDDEARTRYIAADFVEET